MPTHQIHAVIARCRNYAHILEHRQDPAVVAAALRSVGVCLPHLLEHIDAQAQLLGHPRNRREPAEPATDIYGDDGSTDTLHTASAGCDITI